ncbi:MAG: MerR family transcriptional regulator [bacterium]|nr:MerR family transcriptional regulator [bacterium]
MVQEGIREANTFTLPDKKYFKIGETSTLLGVKPHVLRYWETEFPQVRPYKSKTGQRLYRRRDVEALIKIQKLLYEERFTIAGARKVLRLNNWNDVAAEINQEDILTKVETAVANEPEQKPEQVVEVAVVAQENEVAFIEQTADAAEIGQSETFTFESNVEIELETAAQIEYTASDIHLGATTTITESEKVEITFDAASLDGAGELAITRTVVETITLDSPKVVSAGNVLLESAEISLKTSIDETSDESAPEIIKAAMQDDLSIAYENAAVSNAHAEKEAITNKKDVVAECAAQASAANGPAAEIIRESSVAAVISDTFATESVVAAEAVEAEPLATEIVADSPTVESMSADSAQSDKNEMDADVSRILSIPLLSLQKELHEILGLLEKVN